MAVNDIHQVTLKQDLHGQVILNTLHFRVSTVGTGSADLALANYFDSVVVASWQTVMSDEWHYSSTQSQKIHPLPPLLPTIVQANPSDGDIASPSFPTVVAATITKRTANAGTRWRGRVFIAGLPANGAEDSVLGVTALADLQVIAALFFSIPTGTGLNGFVFVPCLFHRDDRSSSDIVSAIARETLRVQRRREVGRGI